MNESSLSLNRSEFDMMMDWEQGDLDCDETIQLFQGLINSGEAWKLPEAYGRTAEALIDAGYCDPAVMGQRSVE